MSKICYNYLLAAFLTLNRPVIVFPYKNPDSNAFSRLKLPKKRYIFTLNFWLPLTLYLLLYIYYPPIVAHLKLESSPYILNYRDKYDNNASPITVQV